MKLELNKKCKNYMLKIHINDKKNKYLKLNKDRYLI
jgi:hypothetical protein